MRIRSLFLFVLLGAFVLKASGQQGGMFRMLTVYRGIKKMSSTRDPQMAIAQCLTLIPQVPQKTSKQKNIATFIGLRLCDLYVRTGNYEAAEKYLDSLVTVVNREHPTWYKSRLMYGSGTVYDVYESLGYLYLKTGNFRKAEEVFNNSLIIRQSVFPKHSVYRVPPVVGLGSLAFRMGNIDDTYRLFNKASVDLSRATTSLYDFDNITRNYLSDLSEICLSTGKNDEAWKYINKLALASSGIAKFGSRIGSRLEIARIFELKARYYLVTGDFLKAQDYLDRAQHYNSKLASSSDVSIKLLKTQALLYLIQGNNRNANSSFIQLAQAYRQEIDRNFIAMSEYEKEQFFNTLKNDLNLFNAYTASQNIAGAPDLYEQMLNNTLNTKALLLNTSNKIRNNIINSGDQALIGKLHEWEEDKALVSSYYFDKDASSKIDLMEKKINDLEREINGRSKLFNSEEHSIKWREIQGTLKSDEAALEVIRINTIDKSSNFYGKNNGLSDSVVYLVLIIRPGFDTPECLYLKDGNGMEHAWLSYYRNSLFARSKDTISYQKFWLPLKDHLSGVRRIFISPDGVYNQINLNTLLNPATGDYLLDEIHLVNLTNCADLLRQPLHAEGKAVLVGRPAYDNRTMNTNAGTNTEYGTRAVLTDELGDFKEQEFSDLVGTETEVKQIGALLTTRGIKVETLLGADALEGTVKDVRNPVVLHIATHGFFVDDQASRVNPMIRSGLILAGVRNPGSSENSDGILTAYEATNLDLDSTNLVVLSACETGLGEVRNGEGVYGLQRAIMVAGATNLLMSLWKVDDEATADLMIEFYRNWTGSDNQEAFRKAQLWIKKKYPDPFYWGAFLMLGK